MLVYPLVRAGQFLFTSPSLGRKRQRTIAIAVVLLAIVVGFITLVPLPLATVTQGVVWLPEEAIVRAQTEGFVEELKVTPGQRVKAGTEIVHCFDPLLSLRLKVLRAQLNELQIEYNTKERLDRVQAQMIADDMKQIEDQIRDARERLALLTVKSTAQGSVFIPMSQDLVGRFVKRGEVIGYVLEKETIAARVAVSQSDADLVRGKTSNVDVRLAESLMESAPTRMIREIPAATENLPSRVLGASGGGSIAVDPRDEHGLKAFQKMFYFDVELPSRASFFNVGGRVYVRFDHGLEPLAGRWYRNVRNLLLRRFNV
jgi:putative peptide zinc metalloprotease protein